jgi:hypothetical protein
MKNLTSKLINININNSDEMWEKQKDVARIDPNRKWFGNVRTID